MNIHLINFLVQQIQSLSEEEQSLLKEKLFFNNSDVTIHELMQIALNSRSFDFIDDEPNTYTFEDGEPVQCYSKKV